MNKYWYCLLHGRVEEGPGCPNSDRLGPYDTKLEAELALEKVRERNEAWDQGDKEWTGDVEG